MHTGRCAVRLLALAALAAAACGDGAATATSAGTDGPAPAEGGSAHVPPGRAKAPVDPAAKPPRPEALVRALATLDESDDPLARDAARREIVAAGTAGLDALLEWFADEDDGDRLRAARELIPAFGLDGCRALAGVLVADDATDRTRRALKLLAYRSMLWSRSEATESIARAAWALCTDAQGRPVGAALDVVVAAGDLASSLAPEILARCRGESGSKWLKALAHRDRIAGAADLCRASALTFIEFLRAEDPDTWDAACDILVAMRSPPVPVIDAVLRGALDDASAERDLCSRIAAAWWAEDPRCAEAARRRLASRDEIVRRSVIDGWGSAPALDVDDYLRAVRLVSDPAEAVARAAARLLNHPRANSPGITDAWRRAMETADGAEAVALCIALSRRAEETAGSFDPPIRDSLLPALLRIAAGADADAAVAAFRVLDRKWRELPPQVAPLGLSRLDDPDPRVRAWACWFADFAHEDDPPNDLDRRIAAAALPLIDSLPPSWERCRAFTAYWYANPEGGREIARRLISDPDADMRGRAEYAIADGRAAGWTLNASVEALVYRSEDDADRDRALAVLLRVDGGHEAALAWLEERLLGETPDNKAEVLRLVVAERDAFADAIPILRRLRDRDGYAPVADVALAAMEPDDDTAVARLTTALPAASEDDREAAWHRLIDLGPRGAALMVRSFHPASTWADGRSIAERERDAVVAEIAALASSRDAAHRRLATAWTTALPAHDAMRILRDLVRDADEDVRVNALGAAVEVSKREYSIRDEVAAWCVPIAARSDDDASAWFSRPRAAAAVAEASKLPEGGAEALRIALRSRDADLRFVASAALVVHDAADDATLAALRTGLGAFAAGDVPRGSWYPAYDGDDERIATLAARAVARLGPRAAALADVLPLVLNTASGSHRAAFCDAIARVGPAAAPCVPSLRWVVLGDLRAGAVSEPTRAAIRALAAIGAAARPAIPELQAAARVAELRDAAETAIRTIEGAR